MKRLLLLCAAALFATSCQTRQFRELPAQGNSILVHPLRLQAGTNAVSLADCLPQWAGADSITACDAQLRVRPLANDWSRFGVVAPAGALVAALDVWQDGRKLSLPVLCGPPDDSVRMFSDGAMLKVVSVRCNREPRRIVALWQNCRLPQSSIVEIDGAFGVIVPKDAKDLDRSWLRVYASTDSALFNDVLIPLHRGRIVKSTRLLTPGDGQARVLYPAAILRPNGLPAPRGASAEAGRADDRFDVGFHRTVRDVLLHDDSIGRIARAVSATCRANGAHHVLRNSTGIRCAIPSAGGPSVFLLDDRAAAQVHTVGNGDSTDCRKSALWEAIAMTVPGVPCLCRDGYRRPGTGDPGNHRMARFDRHVSDRIAPCATGERLIALRRANMPLLYGDLLPLYCDDHAWAFARIYMGQYVVAAFNNSPGRRDLLVELPAGLKPHPLKTNFGGEIRLSPDGRRMAIVLPPYGFEVLTRASGNDRL